MELFFDFAILNLDNLKEYLMKKDSAVPQLLAVNMVACREARLAAEAKLSFFNEMMAVKIRRQGGLKQTPFPTVKVFREARLAAEAKLSFFNEMMARKPETALKWQ